MADPNERKTGGIILNAVNVNADTNSNILVIERGKHVGFDVFLDNNNAVGVIRYMVCNDVDRATPNWVEVANSSVSSGVDVNDFYDFVDIGAKFAKVFYDRTSGDGALTVVAHVK